MGWIDLTRVTNFVPSPYLLEVNERNTLQVTKLKIYSRKHHPRLLMNLEVVLGIYLNT